MQRSRQSYEEDGKEGHYASKILVKQACTVLG